MNLIDPTQSVLVLVDYQQRLLPAIHRGAEVVAHAVRIADVARELGIPVIGTEQYPQGLGPNDDAIRQRCGTTLSKTHFDACADGLLDLLGVADSDTPADARREIVIAGCEAHVCLLQTALGLLRAGLTVSVIAQASGSRTAENHELAMQRLRQAGADIVSVEMVAFEWLRHCRHERFKQVLKLLK
ncbi:MAG: isochorismatase family protein [Pseudomonadota bacterium]|nr:isochorismatase family protein [Pseudomonadota bacterium]